MAKSEERIKAREMRSKGESVREISKILHVSKSTVSLWVRDIILSVEQIEILLKRKIKAGELGRLKGALMQKSRRLELIKKYQKEGMERLKFFSKNEFFVAGIALYWAEGSKKNREVEFCNSDPKLMNFMINWLREFFDVKSDRLALTVGINQIHRDREPIVKKYWSEITNLPLSQFRKTSFKKTKNKKVYANFNDHYGTLSVKILKPDGLCYKILGLIEGLASQGSSVG